MENLNKWDFLKISFHSVLIIYFFTKILTRTYIKPKKAAKNLSKTSEINLNMNLILKNPLPILSFHSFPKFLYVICFTGGPCGGKTSTINYIALKLQQKGFNIIKLEELPTLTVKCGGSIKIDSFTPQESFNFFTNYIDFQIEYENIFRELAKDRLCEGPTVILCDRGINDAWAYMSKEMRALIKNEYDLNIQKMVNWRYDCCVHMVTAADGAEDFYNLSTNMARHEDANKARVIDKIIQNAYLIHKNLQIIDNSSENFEEKMKKTLSCIERQLKCTYGKRLKFEIEAVNFPKEQPFMEYSILKSNLKLEESNLCKRKAILENYQSFTLFFYLRSNLIDKLKYKYSVNSEEYQLLLKEKMDNETFKIIKCFIYENQKMSLEINSKMILRIENQSLNSLKIPPFIKILKQIEK